MKVDQEDNGAKGRFFVKEGDEFAGEMTYTWAGNDRIIIDHTEVNDAFRGKRVGFEMVKTAVEFARAKGISIIPLCPFAKSVFNKFPEFNDVL